MDTDTDTAVLTTPGATGEGRRRSSQKNKNKNKSKFVLQERVGGGSSGSGSSVSGDEQEASSWRTLSFREVAGLWKSEQLEFVETLVSSITALPFEAVFWESIPVTRDTQVCGLCAYLQQQ